MPARSFRGNPRHLTALIDALDRVDIASWNAFARKNGPSFRARLAGADLAGRRLGEANLSGADLTDADLRGCIAARTDFSGARLRGADLSGADLTGTRMNHADFSSANLGSARLTDARARGADFRGANLTGALLDGADMTNAALDGASVTGASRSGAKMKVRVKVRSTAEERDGGFPNGKEGTYSPWIKALDDEERLKELRKNREEEQALAEKSRLEKKLGKRRPLFDRVK